MATSTTFTGEPVVHIESIVLSNFRCFDDRRNVISLKSDLTAFIGTNGAGKTAACQALQRLFGISNAERAIRLEDFHIPSGELEAPTQRSLTVEAILVFPELDEEQADCPDAVPEFFHRMAADVDGKLKCRIVLEATWTSDGTADGSLESKYWAVQTLNETYSDDERAQLPASERARIQMIYVPASRDGVKHVTNFLRGRLWRAARWSNELHQLVAETAKQVGDQFHAEDATTTIESALGVRWEELHGAGTHATPRFQPIEPDVTQLLRGTELVFEPDLTGLGRSAETLSDGQRSLLHLALTAATIDIEKGLSDGSLATSFDLNATHFPALTLLAIEEPENSLSPFYLSRIISQVLAVCRGTRAQAVLASHSASVLNRVEPDNIRYFRLDPMEGSTSVREITLPSEESDAGKYVREAVRAHPELYFARFVVLGEGATEEVVIPRVAQARGIDLDPSFVAMVPLGGRHTNHFWELLNDLQIPHATLLDLDYGRAGAGTERLRIASQLLVDFGVDVFAEVSYLDGPDDLNESTPRGQVVSFMKHLRIFGIFFSAPLDLDMSMMRQFSSAYTTLEDGQRGPQSGDAIEAVIGTSLSKDAIDFWSPKDAEKRKAQEYYLRWYRYLFLGRSKPSTHLRALSRLSDEDLRDAPESLLALIDFTKEKVGL
jgi:predicted ATP-dependent endonuclease of OLD family